MLPTDVRLDPYTTYSMTINEVENRSKIVININRITESNNPDEIVMYTKEDLEKYWETENSDKMHLKITTTDTGLSKRYFILDIVNSFIFIPISNKTKNIINYTVTNLSYLNNVMNHSFTLTYSNPGKSYVKKYVKTRDSASLHSIIFGRKAKQEHKLDHKNSDGLDNRIENIREITNTENTANINTSNKLRGIMWRPKHNKWEAAIKINKKCHYLGLFVDKIEAAKQYDKICVHIYNDIKQLNQIDGKTLLTEAEILEVKNNPVKYNDILYNKKRKNKNIRKTPLGTFTHYRTITKFFIRKKDANEYLENFKQRLETYNINALINTQVQKKDNKYFFCVKISKNFKTFDEASNLSSEIKEHIKELDQTEKDKIESNIDDYRNEDGIAMLRVLSRINGKEMYIGVMVIDEDWLDFIHYSWYFDGEYPKNDPLGALHLAIFSKHYPIEYANRKPGETVDHINRIKTDARIQNLRLAGGSLQSQNRILKRNSLCPYPCVYMANGGFYAAYKNKRTNIKYEYAEDAAQKYNEIVYADNPNSRLNIIPDKKTSIADILSVESLKQLDLNSITTISDIKEIFRFHKWNKGLFTFHDMKLASMEYYKSIILQKINEE